MQSPDTTYVWRCRNGRRTLWKSTCSLFILHLQESRFDVVGKAIVALMWCIRWCIYLPASQQAVDAFQEARIHQLVVLKEEADWLALNPSL